MSCKRSEQCNNGDICPYAKSNAYDMLGGSCYKPKAPMTNFQRITQSEETLAEFISNLLRYGICDIVNECDVCPWADIDCTKSNSTESDLWVKWLKQESDNNEQ